MEKMYKYISIYIYMLYTYMIVRNGCPRYGALMLFFSVGKTYGRFCGSKEKRYFYVERVAYIVRNTPKYSKCVGYLYLIKHPFFL